MLPGKKYAPEDLFRILQKRFWILIVPFAVISAVTAAVVRKLPDYYRSDTLILVVPARVPDTYVKSTVTTRIEDRLQAISQQILSRTRLERIIQDFDLYKQERKTGIMEDIVDNMRKNIEVKVERGDAFRVGFIGRDPRMVMKVADRLASLFIEESLQDRAVLADSANQFLESQLEEVRQRLEESEKKVEAYRKQYAGQLPTQVETNMQAIQNAQMQIQALVESLNRDRDQHLLVERQIGEFEAAAPDPAATPAPLTPDDLASRSIAAQLAAARVDLSELQKKFKPEHPDVIAMQRTVRDLEKQLESQALATPVTAAAKVPPAEAARQRNLADAKNRLEQLDAQITAKQNQEKQLRGIVANYQQRVDNVPTRESEFIELTRDYTTLQSQYTNLLAKKEDSKIAANLERRQIGEQFKLLDPARLPERPFSPNRQQLNLFGILGGLAIGLGLVALLEYRDASFKTDDEITAILALPVLAVVPLMRSDAERRAVWRRKLIVGVGLGSTVAVCLAVLVYTFVR